MASAYPASVLIIVPVENVMTAVFDTPVTAVDVKDTLGIGLLWGAAGESIGDFMGAFSGFLVEVFRSIRKAWPT